MLQEFGRLTPLPINRFSYKIAPDVPDNLLRNLLTPFINKIDSSRDLIIFMISFISSLEVIYVVIPDPKIFFWIAASVVDAAAVNPNDIKTI